MFKRTITFSNLDNEKVTRDFYFNLSADEAIEEELEYGNDGLEGHLKKVLAANDGKELYRIFKRLILRSYGERHEDGERFVKSDELSIAFTQTDAFSVFIVDLSANTELATQFFNGIIPNEAIKRLEEIRANQETTRPSSTSSSEKSFQDYTRDELLAMSDEQFSLLMPVKAMDMSKAQLNMAMERKSRLQ